MKIAVHQPNYLPWLGYFYKMFLADVLVILDTAQFTKNGYQNRVKIKTPTGDQWLSQPVKLSDGAFKTTNTITFADTEWREKHIRTIQMNYGRAQYYSEYIPELSRLLRSSKKFLSEYNFDLIKWMAEIMGIKVAMVHASEKPSALRGTDRLVELVNHWGGDVYISGTGGDSYQDIQLFQEAGIRVAHANFVPRPYVQLWGEFIPGLSIVDLLFNCGSRSLEILVGPGG